MADCGGDLTRPSSSTTMNDPRRDSRLARASLSSSNCPTCAPGGCVAGRGRSCTASEERGVTSPTRARVGLTRQWGRGSTGVVASEGGEDRVSLPRSFASFSPSRVRLLPASPVLPPVVPPLIESFS